MMFKTQSIQDEYAAMRSTQSALYSSLENASGEEANAIKTQIRTSKVECADFVRSNAADRA